MYRFYEYLLLCGLLNIGATIRGPEAYTDSKSGSAYTCQDLYDNVAQAVDSYIRYLAHQDGVDPEDPVFRKQTRQHLQQYIGTDVYNQVDLEKLVCKITKYSKSFSDIFKLLGPKLRGMSSDEITKYYKHMDDEMGTYLLTLMGRKEANGWRSLTGYPNFPLTYYFGYQQLFESLKTMSYYARHELGLSGATLKHVALALIESKSLEEFAKKCSIPIKTLQVHTKSLDLVDEYFNLVEQYMYVVSMVRNLGLFTLPLR